MRKLFITAAFISIGLLITGTLSCADDIASAVETTDMQTAEAVIETEMPGDNLPEADYEGYRFRIGVDEQFEKEVLCSEQEGEVINDAIYNANRSVAERFNIEFVPITFKENSGVINNSIMAGEDAYDLATGHDLTFAGYSLNGAFLNVYDMPYLDLEQPWWVRNTIDAMTVSGRMYLFSNWCAVTGMSFTRAIFMNIDKMNEYNIELPYETVLNGEWTLDFLTGIIKDVYVDVNGDNKPDNGDFYGFANGEYYCLNDSCDLPLVSKDDMGVPYLDIDIEKIMNALTKLQLLINGTPGSKNYSTAGESKHFTDGGALFTYFRLYLVTGDLREAQFTYGILPFPKVDDTQTEYLVGYTDRPFGIPKTINDADRTGVIIEAMSKAGYDIVRPAYFEIALKNKYTYDTESAQMLDIINDTRVLGFWYLYGDDTRDFVYANINSLNVASYFEKRAASMQAHIGKIIAAFETMDN
ncbi:MAG: hypothetical protein PHZ09_02385 [Eubacteriales bacterium]|nr:hypothetical protein [Eubacteriales bacterium]